MTGLGDIEGECDSTPSGSTDVLVRLLPDQLAAVDEFAAAHGGLSRSDAMRRLVERGTGQSSHLLRSS